jgi:hypothetical protein
MSSRSLAHEAETQSRQPWFRAVARVGMATRGAIYLIIGLLAIQVATTAGGTTTGQSGALAVVAQQRFGKALLVLLAVGLAAYALWRLAQGLLDTDDKGDDEKGWAVRAGKVGSGLAYAALCASAVGILAGSGGQGSGSGKTKEATSGVLGWPGGPVWVVLVGLIVLAVAGWNLYRGLSRTFMRRLHPPARVRTLVEWAGVVGMCARAVVFGLIAVLLIKAALEYDPKEAVGLDGALDRLAAESYGGLLLGVVAAGLVAFALYCFAEARYREV